MQVTCNVSAMHNQCTHTAAVQATYAAARQPTDMLDLTPKGTHYTLHTQHAASYYASISMPTD